MSGLKILNRPNLPDRIVGEDKRKGPRLPHGALKGKAEMKSIYNRITDPSESG